MAYTPTKFALPNGLDEIGYEYGMSRISNETLRDFRKRLILESREPSGASESDFIRSVNRQVGEFDEPIFEITLTLDGSGDPVASDPFIEVTSTYLRAYSDYENDILDFELNLVDRNSGYFLNAVETAFSSSSYFALEVLTSLSNYGYLKSDRLRYDNTERMVVAEALRATRSNKLLHTNIKVLKAQNFALFQNEVSDIASLNEVGDFYIDYTNGIVFTEEVASGFVSYSYRMFPFRLYWQSVRAYPANDSDLKYRHYDTLISDSTGLAEHVLLNSEGAKIANRTLEIHPLGWGE